MSRDYKLTFGKYKGETLEEVYLENVGYLEWLLETGISDDLRKKIQDCFREMRRVRIY